ncbi:hypothetical protein Nepgr_014004 [Nepenthes gracilis]|uniref:Uncharacterized protein n=1 Tax=Nepenthes gracilis TaxID=150966 RepID=A0AAD3XPG4_NEPGR|nr:hypothetical protein Nepgr_014004 [Nepenthes gracilis]
MISSVDSVKLEVSSPPFSSSHNCWPSSLHVGNAYSVTLVKYVPYIVASNGRFRSKNGGLSIFLTPILYGVKLQIHCSHSTWQLPSLVAVILGNTVPGSWQECSMYVWSDPEAARREPAVSKDNGLPFPVGLALRWVKWASL